MSRLEKLHALLSSSDLSNVKLGCVLCSEEELLEIIELEKERFRKLLIAQYLDWLKLNIKKPKEGPAKDELEIYTLFNTKVLLLLYKYHFYTIIRRVWHLTGTEAEMTLWHDDNSVHLGLYSVYGKNFSDEVLESTKSLEERISYVCGKFLDEEFDKHKEYFLEQFKKYKYE